MIRAKTNTGIQILGLDAENINRLTQGQPILVSLAQTGGSDDVCIVYGETQDDIKNELEKAFGELPPAKELGSTS